jgi:hypothetical protein
MSKENVEQQLEHIYEQAIDSGGAPKSAIELAMAGQIPWLATVHTYIKTEQQPLQREPEQQISPGQPSSRLFVYSGSGCTTFRSEEDGSIPPHRADRAETKHEGWQLLAMSSVCQLRRSLNYPLESPRQQTPHAQDNEQS